MSHALKESLHRKLNFPKGLSLISPKILVYGALCSGLIHEKQDPPNALAYILQEYFVSRVRPSAASNKINE